MDPSVRGGSQAAVNMVSATPLQPLMATASSSQEDMMGTLIQKNRQEIQKALPQTSEHSWNSCSSGTDDHSVRFNSPGRIKQIANTNQNQNQIYRNSNNNNRYKHNQNNKHNNGGNQQINRYNNNWNTPSQPKNRNNTNQQPCRHCNRTNLQSRDCQACFTCRRLGHMSR